MAEGDFVWCDLSAYRVAESKQFYATLFVWSYHRLTQPDGTAYEIASTSAGEAAAIFAMPDKFRKIELPSFWMPYMAIDDIEAACAKAQQAGGKLEVGPLAFSETESIALIRDPLGAGFTVYQGDGLQPRSADAGAGHMVWNALYVSDAASVTPFYEALLGWRIVADPSAPGLFHVYGARDRVIAEIHELSEAIRGRYQFWGIHFGVADVPDAKARIKQGGGEIVYEDAGGGETTTLVRDPDGAAFFVRQAGGAERRSAPAPSSGRGPVKWRTMLALAVIYAAIVFEQDWVWGVLFIVWTIPALRYGETFFVERLTRRANPVLFWLTVITWIALSLYLVWAGLGTAGWWPAAG